MVVRRGPLLGHEDDGELLRRVDQNWVMQAPDQ